MKSKPSWPRSTPARAGRYGCWATPASPSPSAPVGSPTTSSGSPTRALSLRPGSRLTAARSTRPTRRRWACSAEATPLRPNNCVPSTAGSTSWPVRARPAARWPTPYAPTSGATAPSRSLHWSSRTLTPRTWQTGSAPGSPPPAPLTGPAMVGPGWTAEREYQAGDRVLLHARCGPSGTPAVNGATATVTDVNSDGLAVRLDGSGEAMSLPAAFVQGTRKDGSPNLSHAWARTVDGAQGGTWEACHLLGSAALDAYRGYTGQSRSRQPTHTWNTARVAVARPRRDACRPARGGRAGRRCACPPAGPIPGGTQRPLGTRPPAPRTDRRAREGARRPAADRQEVLAAATKDLEAAESWLANMDAVASHTARQLEDMGPLAGLSPRRRGRRRLMQDKLGADTERAAAATDKRNEVAGRVDQLRHEQGALERFEAAEGWRQDDVARLQSQLDHHWAEVVAACVRADDPLAYGVDKLRHARATTAGDLRAPRRRDPRRPGHRTRRSPPAARRCRQGATTSRRGARECTRRLRRERAPSVGT